MKKLHPKILKTASEYQQALRKVETLMDAAAGSSAEEDLELWSFLVERYEQEHFPIDFPDPVEAIKFRMEQEGMRQKDLEKLFPSKSRVSEILSRKRTLSLDMIRSLHQGLGIPTEILVRKYSPRKPRAKRRPFKAVA
jgi:HTH-type transcriptional regulator/antitoxin HigA